MARVLMVVSVLFWGSQVAAADQEPIFSGPQEGEKLAPFKMQGVLGDQAGREIDLVTTAAGKPIVLIFFHQRTRPAFGLTNAVMRYAATRADDGLSAGVCFLTEDATAIENWMKIVAKHFASGPTHGISLDGLEGPGAYGLNRNVELTVLVGKEGRVTANFALVQPSLAADGPKILQAIVDAVGSGNVPDLARPDGRPVDAQRMRGAAVAEQMRPLLRPVIDKQATPEQVDKAAATVEAFISENEAAKRELGRIARTIVDSGKLENYGTSAAQAQIRKWARSYGSGTKPQRPRKE